MRHYGGIYIDLDNVRVPLEFCTQSPLNECKLIQAVYRDVARTSNRSYITQLGLQTVATAH